MKDKPDDSEILLHKLFNICYNSRDYDSCIDIGISLNDTESLKNMLKKDIFNHITHQSKIKLLKYFSKLDNENAKNYLTEFIEKLIEEQDNNSYDIATEGFIVLKNIMKNEEWKEYLEKIHKKHYRKINLWKKAKLKGIIN
jgi:predicted transcriptional regulator